MRAASKLGGGTSKRSARYVTTFLITPPLTHEQTQAKANTNQAAHEKTGDQVNASDADALPMEDSRNDHASKVNRPTVSLKQVLLYVQH
jgi:hypothetical protein